MTVVNQNLPIPAEYSQLSQEFSVVWNDWVDRGEYAKSIFTKMINVLESNGYTRTQAIEKIESDHKHLKGFSRATIYRELPDDMKRKYDHKNNNAIVLPDITNVSFETFENDNNLSIIETKEVDEKLKELPPATEEPIQQQEHDDDDDQTTEIFDKDFVNKLIQENKQLQDENNNLKVLVGATEETKADNRNPIGKYSKREYSLFNPQKTKKVNLETPLTPQEQEYVQAHEDETKRNQQIAELIFSLTNLSIPDQAKVVSNLKDGENLYQKLVEASSDYMLKISKQMITSDITTTLTDLRVLKHVIDGFRDILYEEQELRKKKAHLESI